jgi:hypothetical protein
MKSRGSFARRRLAFAMAFALACAVGSRASFGAEPAALDGFLGTWRGSSACTDLVADPACRDEVVVYDDVRPSGKVRQGEGCWRTEFETPPFHDVWCLVVKRRQMTGTLRLLPSGSIVRRVQLRHD